MHGRDQPDIDQANEKCAGDQGMLDDVQHAKQARAGGKTAQWRGHAAADRLTRPGEGDQERAEMMHRQVLQPVQEEHVLRHVIEVRLQHGVDQAEAGDE